MMIGDIVGYVNVPMPSDEYHEIRAKLLSSGWRVGWTDTRENFTCVCGSVHAVSIIYHRGNNPILAERTFDVCLVCDRVNEVKPVAEQKPRHCPQCDSLMVETEDGSSECAFCGLEWVAVDKPVAQTRTAAPVVAPVAASPVVAPVAASPVVAPVAASPVVAPVSASPVEVLERRYFDTMDYTEMEWYVRHVESEIKHLEELLESFGIDPNKSYSVSDVMAIKAALVGKV